MSTQQISFTNPPENLFNIAKRLIHPHAKISNKEFKDIYNLSFKFFREMSDDECTGITFNMDYVQLISMFHNCPSAVIAAYKSLDDRSWKEPLMLSRIERQKAFNIFGLVLPSIRINNSTVKVTFNG